MGAATGGASATTGRATATRMAAAAGAVLGFDDGNIGGRGKREAKCEVLEADHLLLP